MRTRTCFPLLAVALLGIAPGVAMAQQRPAVVAAGAPVARPAPMATLPAVPPAVGLPQLQTTVSCPALQQRVQATLGGEQNVWSITVADASGRLLADVNGTRPRIPASNEKLISTAFALDRLGPDYRLSTRLWRLPDGTLRLTGEGDPDLAVPQLQRFAKLALGSGGSTGDAPGVVTLQLAEEPAQAWWPQGWHPADRVYAYGAPITRLAVTSNAIHDAVANPPARLQALLQRLMTQQGGKSRLALVPASTPLPEDAVLLHEENSLPMYGLLSLANTESHNFTAEVLLRSASGTWNLDQARQQATLWLQQQGLPTEGVRVVDGSGLDRANRLTSRLLAALLLRMDQHPYGRQYQASMAVAGQRGTLRNLYIGTPLQGRFRGKTGTISGVRSISGYLDTAEGIRYVSAIANGAAAPNQTIGQVLRQAQTPGLCPAT
ncbi:MAG: D-alanyl-D-alanine carboxypeptidase/D-alanyl-D-alanine-endopeptidase [Synechococcus sp.]|nr:D-alanyl-D-alanine carboxypeptidase/D-alanyl-D-alanine-endopeptidase [Synechococcus sp.]